MLLLNHKEILQNLPYNVAEQNNLSASLTAIFNRSEDIHILASILLWTFPREKYIENPAGAALCITDAFLRKNKKKISLGYVTEPDIDQNQQVTKIVAMMGDIVASKTSIADIRTWMLWHVVDTSHNDDIWGFHKENKDLIKIMGRFTKTTF